VFSRETALCDIRSLTLFAACGSEIQALFSQIEARAELLESSVASTRAPPGKTRRSRANRQGTYLHPELFGESATQTRQLVLRQRAAKIGIIVGGVVVAVSIVIAVAVAKAGGPTFRGGCCLP